MKSKKMFFGMFLFTLFFIGCNEIGNDDLQTENKSGSIVVNITDAPFPSDLVAEANITVDRIEIKKSDYQIEIDKENKEKKDKKDKKDKNENEEVESDSLIVLSEDIQTFNLLDLSNGVTANMAALELPTGEYSEIRLHIIEASILLNSGEEFDLTIPSGGSSGLKIKIKPSILIVQNMETEVLLDFDVSRSFKVKGNIKNKHGFKGFAFKPVVRAVNRTESGEITGYVTNETEEKIQGALITLFSGTDTLTTALSSKNGYYAIIGIPPGEYNLECFHEDYQKASVEGILVNTDEETNQDFILLE